MERWEFIHDAEMNAEKHYKHSTMMLILKNRTLVLQVPCEMIENNNSWKKVE